MASKHGSKSPRKKAYKAREINLNAAGNAFATNHAAIMQKAHQVITAERMARPLDKEQRTEISFAYRMAFDLILKGRGKESDWNTVVCSLNIAMVLAEAGFGREYQGQIIESLDGVFRAKERHAKTGKWGFDGPAITSIKTSYEVHEAQLEIVTGNEIMVARDEIARRVESGNVYRDAAQ